MAIVWQISAIKFDSFYYISGTLLSKDFKQVNKDISRYKTFSFVLRSYFKKRYKNKEIAIVSGENIFYAKTDYYGKFSFKTDKIFENDLRIYDKNLVNKIPVIQDYPIFFTNDSNSISIISDIDDTILKSNTANVFKRLKTLFFTPAHKRKSIKYIKDLFDKVKKHNVKVYYVSKSEANLFGLLTYFIKTNNLPEGNLFLTNYLSFYQLFNSKKGKDYKKNTIEFIIKNSKSQKFILLGDDTQYDINVYSEIAKKYSDKIVKIFIHKTGKNQKSKNVKIHNDLKSINIPTVCFSKNDEIKQDLENLFD